ncbi:PilZ domain-containing protein [Dyella sp.]|uniref:PilZ domain-containing protein n=1 Tax=Dyella sp. TaxID=1869338 RepID=UPI002ED47491
MQIDTWQDFSERVSYEDRLHLCCAALGEWDEQRQSQIRERNLHVLATLDSLEERRADIDEEAPLVQELARIDNKLNVLMDIVTRLLVPESILPPRQSIRLNALGALVPSQVLPPVDGPVLLTLHVDACRALPLEFSAQVTHSATADMTLLVFDGLGDAVLEGLERFVFRHHRRKVAEARQSLT